MTRLLALVAALVVPSAALAGEIRELRTKPVLDWTVTAALGAVWIGTELDKGNLAPETCRWCEPPAFDVAARRAMKWEDTKRAATISDVIGFAGMPVLMLGGGTLLASQHDLGNAPEDAMIVVQSAVAASLVNQVVKLSVGRERPFVHALDPDDKHRTDDPHDNNLSFYSGHTSLAFALATSTATVATMRGYRHAWVVWPVGLSLAASVGWLRMAADKHWLSDVATGAAIGSATGVLIPLLAHPPRRSAGDGTVVLESRGPMLVATFVF